MKFSYYKIVTLAFSDRVKTEELKEPVLVYNFEVEDFHTYYVSELGVLVHNTCMVAGGSRSGKAPVTVGDYN